MRDCVLNEKQMQALLQIGDGATIYDYKLAKTFREIQKVDWRLLNIVDDMEELASITGEDYTGVESLPYFGVYLSEKGKKIVDGE